MQRTSDTKQVLKEPSRKMKLDNNRMTTWDLEAKLHSDIPHKQHEYFPSDLRSSMHHQWNQHFLCNRIHTECSLCIFHSFCWKQREKLKCKRDRLVNNKKWAATANFTNLTRRWKFWLSLALVTVYVTCSQLFYDLCNSKIINIFCQFVGPK